MGERLSAASRDLAAAVDGIDWDSSAVQRAVDDVRAAGKKEASGESLDAALAVLVERLRRSSVEDADGVSYVAITGGTLVEYGATPVELGAVLLEKLPAVLSSARRYADRCLADARTPEEYPDEEVDEITEVDGRPILSDVFREHLEADRPGGAALAYLGNWILPAVAAWTRDRPLLERATRDTELVRLAQTMENSSAHFLSILLSVQLDAPWLVLCPLQGRGFRLRVDGVVSNFDLHALLASALVARGIDGTASPDDVVAFLEGRIDVPPARSVHGTWNLYDFRAATFDLGSDKVPTDYWVWGEGVPTDVPSASGVRTLLVGPAAYARTWGLGRVFSALRSRVSVEEELEPEAYQRELSRLIDAARD